jgi:hypothetical protein
MQQLQASGMRCFQEDASTHLMLLRLLPMIAAAQLG